MKRLRIALVVAYPNPHVAAVESADSANQPASAAEHGFEINEGTTLAGFLAMPDIQSRFDIDGAAAVGVWGKVVPRDQLLRDGDRVEFYQPLKADPKEARRAKARK